MPRTPVETAEQRETVHIVMRYADDFGGTDDVIESHRHVLREAGTVWVGKMGKKSLNERVVDQLNEQISNGVPTYVYLAKRANNQYTVHKGRLLEVRRAGRVDQSLIPEYYRNDTWKCCLWLHLSSLVAVNPQNFAGVVIKSSGKSASEALALSMAGLFIVRFDAERARMAAELVRSGKALPPLPKKPGRRRATSKKQQDTHKPSGGTNAEADALRDIADDDGEDDFFDDY